MWINQGDTVLVALHEFTTADENALWWKYTPDETRSLKAYGEILNTLKSMKMKVLMKMILPVVLLNLVNIR